MNLTREFEVSRSRDEVVDQLCRDETLLELLTQGETEIVERDGDRRTTRTSYLGRQLTFHFAFLMDGDVRFEKVCDGNVWRELIGAVSFHKHGEGTLVTLKLKGRTKTLVPELAIRGEMRKQIDQMASALQACIEAGENE